MLGWVKKIFGAAAAPPPSPPPPQVTVQSLAKAGLVKVPQKSIWDLIRANDTKGLQELITADPAQLKLAIRQPVRKRINVNMKPAHYAAFLGQAEALILLHQNGVHINETSKNGYNCLHLAGRCKTGGVATAYLLQKSTLDINAVTNDGATALMEAARSGNAIGVQELLKKNPQTDVATAQAAPAIVAAARNGHDAIVTMLAEHGASLDVTDSLQRNALWHAVHERRTDTADYLLSKGASTTVVDLQGHTLLMTAAQRGNLALVTKLLDAGHDPNERDNNGNTALHYAATDNQVDGKSYEIGLLLTSRGAWVDAHNNLGESPAAYATGKGGKPALITYLRDALDDPSAPHTPTLSDVFAAGAKQEVKVMKALKIRMPSNQPSI